MKLITLNISIRIDNSQQVGDFLNTENPDFVVLQEVVRPLEDTVEEKYKSQPIIEKIVQKYLPYKFFGPLWVADVCKKNGEVYRNYGGMIEQGNEVLSRFPIVDATNEYLYKHYAYAVDRTHFKRDDLARAVQVVEFLINDKKLQILNLHGIWTEDKKGDQRTIDECKYIINAAKRHKIATIITGDFNLLPSTESIHLLDKEFRNLVSEYKIMTTRPDFNDTLETGNSIVDYVFVNDQIKVKDFKVIQTNISDHFPLLLEFELC